MTEPHRVNGDRRITILLVLSGVVVTLIALGTPAVIGTANTAEAIERGDDISGCRSAYNAVVTDRRTDFDVARSQRDTAEAEVVLITNEITEALAFGDDDRVAQLLPTLPPARDEVRRRNGLVAGADAALKAANDDFQAAVSLSREDPEGFLTQCKEIDP